MAIQFDGQILSPKLPSYSSTSPVPAYGEKVKLESGGLSCMDCEPNSGSKSLRATSATWPSQNKKCAALFGSVVRSPEP